MMIFEPMPAAYQSYFQHFELSRLILNSFRPMATDTQDGGYKATSAFLEVYRMRKALERRQHTHAKLSASRREVANQCQLCRNLPGARAVGGGIPLGITYFGLVGETALKHTSVLWTDLGSWSSKKEQLRSVASSCTGPHLKSIQRVMLGFLDASYSKFDVCGENLVGKSKLCHRSAWYKRTRKCVLSPSPINAIHGTAQL